MKSPLKVVAAIFPIVVGCASPERPVLVQVTGSVAYEDGRPVERARVTASGGAFTFTDARGRYVLTLPAMKDTISLSAEDGHDGYAHAVTCSGGVRIVLGSRGASQDIVLDHCRPI